MAETILNHVSGGSVITFYEISLETSEALTGNQCEDVVDLREELARFAARSQPDRAVIVQAHLSPDEFEKLIQAIRSAQGRAQIQLRLISTESGREPPPELTIDLTG